MGLGWENINTYMLFRKYVIHTWYHIEGIPLKQQRNHSSPVRLADVKLNQVMQKVLRNGTLTLLVVV